ncbi:MAG: hypothetical protein OWQ48_05390 [Desulfurococcus sp.]|nr:hypothetical protein [Desulfurococcus sp.]
MSVERSILLKILEFRRMLIDELSSLHGISEERLREILEKYSGLVDINGRIVVAVKPLELALKLLEQGVSVERISRVVSWRDFERLAAYIMSENKYLVESNMTLTAPVRLEVDVTGVDPASGLTVIVDCKHWSHNTRGRLIEAGVRHLERVAKIIQYYDHLKSKYRILEYARSVIPVILTLQTPPLRVYEGVLYVNAREFNEFLVNIRYVMDVFEVKPLHLPSRL